MELVTDRAKRTPATAAASQLVNRLKEERIVVSTDGPDENVIKFKPPMCFSAADAELVAEKIDHILTGMESERQKTRDDV